MSAQHRRRRHSTRIYFEAKQKGNFGNRESLKPLKPFIFNGLSVAHKGNKSVIGRLGDYLDDWLEEGKSKSFKISSLQKYYLHHYPELPAKVIGKTQ
jgi:hypothetical protein